MSLLQSILTGGARFNVNVQGIDLEHFLILPMSEFGLQFTKIKTS